jgi:hypothetical protein
MHELLRLPKQYSDAVKDIKNNPETMFATSEPPSRALQSASTTDILRVAESTGLQQDCRWFQRLGSTIRLERIRHNDTVQSEPGAVETNGNDGNSRANLTYDDAVRMYLKALEIDSSDAVARTKTLRAKRRRPSVIFLKPSETERNRQILNILF